MNSPAVITGATGGLGKAIARGLVRRGMPVILGARSLSKAEEVRRELMREPGGGQVQVLPLDVASMASVRAFAGAIAQTQPRLQLLVNCAGAWFNARAETAEGHERTLATNLLGPYLLTQLLLPQLRAGGPGRIVNIVSSATGSYDADDLDWRRRKYDGFNAYRQSKQALRMATWTLAQRLEGSGVVANAVSPGFVRTDFLRDAGGPVAGLLRLIAPLAAVTPDKGAETPLHVALAPELSRVSGKYFEAKKEKDGGFRDQAALDELERRLEEIIGVTGSPG